MQVSNMQSDGLQQEVNRPKATFKPTSPKKSGMDGGLSLI